MPCEPKTTILLVDDNPNDVALVRRAFEWVGVENPLVVCESADQALAYLRTHELPCLMLLDVKMPGRDGFYVLKEVRGDAKLKDLIVIVLTTSSEISDINRAYQLGANSFLTKPVDLSEFRYMVDAFHKYWVLRNQPPAPDTGGGKTASS